MAEQLQYLTIDIRKTIDAELQVRVARATQFLLEQITNAYDQVFKGNSGAAGASNALEYEIKKAGDFLEVTFGISKADKGYLAFLEFGERGTESAGKDFVDIGTNTRSKAPPINPIMKWLKISGVPVPQYFVKRAERMERIARSEKKPKKWDPSKPWNSVSPNEQFAFAIAQKIKRKGRPALRIIERMLAYHAANIQRYLEGAI